ncbi:autotransporter domain-containing protein [Pandoraea sputorum]|uniref:autotransporter domain-containing protein n=1 Tax=Pandoraea sputorum TaxID=93222 RepID=UPI00123F8C1F|nr:autotransporter domain-containing protein [Pandoraea sputorum]
MQTQQSQQSQQSRACQPFRIKHLVRALAGIGCLAAGPEMAFAQCATTTTQTNANLGAGACVDVSAGTTGAWVLNFVGNYVAAGNNILTVNTQNAIFVDTVTGPSDSISVTLNGPTLVTSTATGIGGASLLYAFAQDPAHTATVIVNSNFAGTVAGFDPQAITAWGAGASIAFHGVAAITASGYGTAGASNGVLNAINGGTIVSDNSITVRALNGMTPDGIVGVTVAPRSVVDLRGHVDVEVASVGRGADVNFGTLTVVGTDTSSRIVGGVGIAAAADASVTLKGITVQSLNGDGIVLSGARSTLTGTDLLVDATGGKGLNVSAGSATLGASNATAKSAITTHGAAAHGIELTGGSVDLGQTQITTTGAGAYGLHLSAGTLRGRAGLSVTTQADGTAGVVLEPGTSGAVTLTLDPGTTITTQGQNADGLSVRGAGSYTLDGSGLSLANLSVASGALIEAHDGGSLTLRSGAVFASPAGARLAATGADPLTWGAKAGSGGTMTLADDVSTNGNGLWATAGGTVQFLGTASAPDAVVRLDAASGAAAAGTLDATAHSGPLTLGYLEGGGTVKLGAGSLNLGGSQPMAGAYTFSGAINGTGSLTKSGTNTQVLSGGSAWGFGGDVYLNGGVLEVAEVGDTTKFVKTFHLNGGWLDLSANNVPFDAGHPQTAANWGITVLDGGGGGGVIGVNDNLVVTGGQSVAYQIGSSASPKGAGLYVIKEGAGTAQLTGENQYVGATQIRGGALQVTRDANLGDTTLSREIRLMGGDLQISNAMPGLPSSFASRRMVQLYRDGRVSVDDGVTASLGSVVGVSGNAAFAKAGAGSLSLGSATLTGGLSVQQGALTISGGTIANATGAPIIAAADGTSVTLSNVGVAGGGDVYSIAAGGRGVFNASASMLSGAMTADGGGQTTVVDATLAGGTTFSGRVNQSNGGEVNLTLADARTTWKLNGNASVNDLSNLGSIAFVQQPAAAGAGPYYTLSVNGNYRGGGSITLNTYLNAGGASHSFTDRLVIAGNVSGVTTLQLNTQGTGANSNMRLDNVFHADEGISLVQVSGHAGMSAFQLDRPYVGAPGSIYQYRLFAYGPGSKYGVADPSTQAQWDYRLQTAYEDQSGNIVPGVDPEVRPMVLPQAGAYLMTPLALQRYGAMIMDSLHTRLGDMRRQAEGAGEARAEVFARVMAETGDYGSNVPWRKYGVDFNQRSEAVQFGGNVARYRLGERDSLRVGIAGTVGSSTATPKDGAGMPSKLSLQAQSLAFSATWENLSGWYADAIVAGNFYRASVNGQTKNVGTLYGTGLDVSLEGGKRVNLPSGWQVETSAQVMSQSMFLRDMTDKDGVSVALGTSHAWTTLAGVRFSYPIEDVASSWTPYVGVGLSYTWLDGANPVLAGTAFDLGKVGAAVRVAVGANGQVTQRLAVYGELNAQTNVDNYGVSAIGARLGVRYRF